MSKSRLAGFSLPTTGIGGALLSPITGVAQTLVDYGAATISQKVSESLGKLVGSGQTENFKRVSGKVGLANLPSGTAVTDALTGQQIFKFPTTTIFGSASDGVATEPTTSSFKVKLSTQNFEYVIFDVMPTIDEGHSAEYVEFNPMHHPGAILKYRRTGVRTWGIGAKLIARNSAEAAKNLETVNIIRSWVMPQYGEGTAKNLPGVVLGAPPPIITLSAYGNRVIGPVKCVLESFRWTFNNDVDYLPTVDINARGSKGGQAPFPAIIDVSLSLKESWSPAEFSGFDLNAYVNGRLSGENGAFFARRVERAQQNTASAPVAPSSMDTFMSGGNSLRRFEVSEPREITPSQIAKTYNPNATTEGAAQATDIGDFASHNGIQGA